MNNKDATSELIRAKDIGAFDRWSLPSFDPEGAQVGAPDAAPATAEQQEPSVAASPGEPVGAQAPVEEVALEDVKPLTLDELEAIRQDAYNEGFATGEKDGFRAGQLKAKQEADLAIAVKLQQLETLMGNLMAPIADQDKQIEQGLIALLGHLAREVIQRELSRDSSQIRVVLREALKVLPMGAENVRIHLNPQDFEMVKALRDRHEEKWRILEDETLLPGGCRIESEQSRIDASVETRLSQALKQLFAQQREQATQPPAADMSIDLNQPQGAPHAP
ncbi:flagellar assembly protein FliH [Pseudomonas sp. RIT-PI-AD]|uniref:flagellar assembly protein FliH n=1 Tax=Pseudomonas sp. RIT-PI-AD TaxID=3035294 RepID=UPI0021DA121D|nr:flagellar assembly protein FliH [Pseudomonas sp. RIT-PI-AD]